MKRRWSKVILAVLLAAALAAGLYFLPLPVRVDVTREGWLMSAQGEVLADDVAVTLTSWELRYLFRSDGMEVEVSASSETEERANASWEPQACALITNEDWSVCSGMVYDAQRNEFLLLSLVYTGDFDALRLDWEGETDGAYWLAGTASDPSTVESALERSGATAA